MSERESRIASAFEAACRDEIEAPKPGNVHLFASGHRMTAQQFLDSAAAASGPLATRGARVGWRICAAVEATFAAVGTNTNLGIVLLCAPLAAAAERRPADLRPALADVLAGLDVEDAKLAFEAILKAAPAGLGRAERHDVTSPARVSLREAMAEAAGRDRIAAQYASDFADIFEFGIPLLDAAETRFGVPRWATLATYLGFLSAFPDSHIVRKYGISVAEEVRGEAATYDARLRAASAPDELLGDLLSWDRSLKIRQINPGTSADLTVATCFVRRLRNILPSARNSG